MSRADGNDSSYDISRVAGSTEGEIDRLGAQVDLFANIEMPLYQRFGLTSGMSVVELGCGPGFLLERLRDTVPALRLTGLEIDELLVKRADALLWDNDVPVKVVQGRIEDTGFLDEEFDFAISRLVLEHLPDPMRALREVLRVLRPGGTAVFVDNDFAMHVLTYPHIPELEALYDAYRRARRDEGGNPTIGRQLPALLRAAGYEDVRFDVLSAHSQVVGKDAFLRSEGSGIPRKLVQDGYLDSSTMARLAVGWRKMLRRDDHAIVRQLYAAAGRKPHTDND
jgi:SAM-dependent methyltransferase